MGTQYFPEGVIQNEEVAPELLLDLASPLRFDLVAPVLEYLPLPKRFEKGELADGVELLPL